jgi:acyl-CoA hydrolase
VVTLRARVLATFRSSMEVGVRVTAENPLTGETHLTTTALLTFVALNPDGSRAEVRPLKLEREAERAAFHAAHSRRRERLERKGALAEWQRLLEP